MGEPFIGSEAVAAGVVTRHELRTRFVAGRGVATRNVVAALGDSCRLPATAHATPHYNEHDALIGEVDRAWPDKKIALEYEGRGHLDPDRFRKDILRVEEMIEADWIVIRVTSRDGSASVLKRLANAWSSRA